MQTFSCWKWLWLKSSGGRRTLIQQAMTLMLRVHGEPDFIIFLDASLLGWGSSCDLGQTGGHWLVTETGMSINALELKAGLFGLQSLLPSTCRHIRMMLDKTTTVACVNKMGQSLKTL